MNTFISRVAEGFQIRSLEQCERPICHCILCCRGNKFPHQSRKSLRNRLEKMILCSRYKEVSLYRNLNFHCNLGRRKHHESEHLLGQLVYLIYPPQKALASTPAMTRSIANNMTISNTLSFIAIPHQARGHPFMFKPPLSPFHLGLMSNFVESAVSWDLPSPCPTLDA